MTAHAPIMVSRSKRRSTSFRPWTSSRPDTVAAARALDGGHWEEARERLRSAPLVRCDRSQRLVAVALWQRILAHPRNGNPAPDSDGTTFPALNEFRAAALNAAHVWRMFQAIPVLIERIGAVDAAAVVATTAWDLILASHPAVFTSAFELFYKAGGQRCMDAWQQFLTEQRNWRLLPRRWRDRLPGIRLRPCRPRLRRRGLRTVRLPPCFCRQPGVAGSRRGDLPGARGDDGSRTISVRNRGPVRDRK
jgi:hypothetical protein